MRSLLMTQYVLSRCPAVFHVVSGCARSGLCAGTPLACSQTLSKHADRSCKQQALPRQCFSIQAAQQADLYSQPELYDKAFSFRGFEEEVDFLKTMLESTDTGGSKSFLELGCGPGRHASMLQLATTSQGFALDNSEAMLAYARKLASDMGAAVEFQHGDMQMYKLQKPVDMVFMVLGTFAHLLDTDAALQCLHSTHAALKPGGVLVLELSHPAEAFDGSLMETADWNEAGQQPDEGQPGELAVQYGKDGDHFDPIEQVLQRTVTICKATTSGSLQQIISVVVPQRIYTFQELKLLAILSSFGEVKTFGDMNVASHFDEDAARMVVVLRRL